jgi:NADPH2 dehydrogenase
MKEESSITVSSSVPPKSLANSNLFEPIKVGPVILKNRLVHAPTTRFRNSEDFVATDSMLEYYTDRAENNGGLLIVEATFPAPEFGLFENAPMIHTPAQVKAFRKITDSVHSKGTFIAAQLWNLGRTADPLALKKRNLPFVAPSAIYFDEASEKAAKEVGNELREITIPEIKAMIKEYAASAKRAVDEAGFDIVEIHAAHQYLLDQFLQQISNKRTDEYGGSIENRAKFILEVVDAIIEAVGAERVAIRVSPYAEYQGGAGYKAEINPIVTWGYLLSELERRAKEGKRLAYISLVEPRFPSGHDNSEAANVDFTWPELIWKGVIIRAGGYLDSRHIDRLEPAVNKNDRTLIAVGRYFTSNPDLVERVKKGLEITAYNRDTFYVMGSNIGYLGYSKYGEGSTRDTLRDGIKLQPLA